VLPASFKGLIAASPRRIHLEGDPRHPVDLSGDAFLGGRVGILAAPGWNRRRSGPAVREEPLRIDQWRLSVRLDAWNWQKRLDGAITDVRNGTVYVGAASLSPADTLVIEACIKGTSMCGQQVWTRASISR
jgi:hypothetical protein